MTCKDCVYFKRCVVLGVELDMHHNKEADKNCRHFKNKADVAEVVRCKDCKYWNNAEVDYKGAPIKTYAGNCQCSQWENEYYWYATTENDFCSYGERKE